MLKFPKMQNHFCSAICSIMVIEPVHGCLIKAYAAKYALLCRATKNKLEQPPAMAAKVHRHMPLFGQSVGGQMVHPE